MKRLFVTGLLVVALVLSACDFITGDVGEKPEVSSVASVSEDSIYYHCEMVYPSVVLPAGWAAAEGPEDIARPFEGQAAFNSWGEPGFWARESGRNGSYSYGPFDIMAQVPDGEAYVVLFRIWGPDRPRDYNPLEYSRSDLSGLLQPHDWRQDADSIEGVRSIQFYKLGRDLQLEIACHPDASDDTVATLNALLQSWRFPATLPGDTEWAGIQARQLLPEKVKPLRFSNRPGSCSDEEIIRMTLVERRGDVLRFLFMYRWDIPSGPRSTPHECPGDSCHWWEIDVSPTGEAVLVGEGGAKLPFIWG